MRTRHTPRRLQALLLLGLTLFAATALADYRFQWRYGNLPGETPPTSGDAGVNRIYVGSGSYTSAIVTASGDLWMSGWNSNGNLGNASMSDQYSWVQVLSGVSEVALGIEHSLALRADGSLWGAGAGGRGVFGLGASRPNLSTWTEILPPDSVAKVFSTTLTSFILTQDNSLLAAGYNAHYQAGVGTTTQIDTWTPVLTEVAAVAGNQYHTLALKTDGTVWGAGSNQDGRLGFGNPAEGAPDFITTWTQIPGLAGVTQISAGIEHSLALKSDGTVWVAGSNWAGELGVGDYSPRWNFVQSASGVRKIAAGWDFSVLLMTDGRVQGAGWNDHGPLGGGPYYYPNSWVTTKSSSGFSSIQASTSASWAIDASGQLWYSGSADYGTLGTGQVTAQMSWATQPWPSAPSSP